MNVRIMKNPIAKSSFIATFDDLKSHTFYNIWPIKLIDWLRDMEIRQLQRCTKNYVPGNVKKISWEQFTISANGNDYPFETKCRMNVSVQSCLLILNYIRNRIRSFEYKKCIAGK